MVDMHHTSSFLSFGKEPSFKCFFISARMEGVIGSLFDPDELALLVIAWFFLPLITCLTKSVLSPFPCRPAARCAWRSPLRYDSIVAAAKFSLSKKPTNRVTWLSERGKLKSEFVATLQSASRRSEVRYVDQVDLEIEQLAAFASSARMSSGMPSSEASE